MIHPQPCSMSHHKKTLLQRDTVLSPEDSSSLEQGISVSIILKININLIKLMQSHTDPNTMPQPPPIALAGLL